MRAIRRKRVTEENIDQTFIRIVKKTDFKINANELKSELCWSVTYNEPRGKR